MCFTYILVKSIINYGVKFTQKAATSTILQNKLKLSKSVWKYIPSTTYWIIDPSV